MAMVPSNEAELPAAIPFSPDGLERLKNLFRKRYRKFSRFSTDEEFHKGERAYKDELRQQFMTMVAGWRPLWERGVDEAGAAQVIDDTQKLLSAKLQSINSPQNLLGWRYFEFLRKLDDGGRIQFAGALLDLVFGPEESAIRAERFVDACWPTLEQAGAAGPAWSRSFPTLFLTLLDPQHDIFIRTSTFDRASKTLRGQPLFENRTLDAAEYRKAQVFAAELTNALEGWGWEPRDLIDVQSFVFTCDYMETEARRKGEEPLKPNGNPPGTGSDPAETLEQHLAGAGLYFPAEVVANYILALQTRRFVILTGISGTGKTQLALKAAEFYRPFVQRQRSTGLSPSAVEVRVYPYMLRHGGMTVPARIAKQLRLRFAQAQPNAGQIPVQFPGGQTALAFWKDPQGTQLGLSFRGEFRRWFRETLKPGDRFIMTVEDGADEDPHGLLITLPEVEQSPEPLDNSVVIAVRPDWTDGRALLGYLNPITGHYVLTPFLRLLLRTAEEESAAGREKRTAHPFFVVLDEMNLARVEHYFSDFLSALESGEPIHLHEDEEVEQGEGEDGVAVPRRLHVPRNVFFTGTVNVDETTYMFSPKVLDRAFTIELSDVDLRSYGNSAVGEATEAGGLRLKGSAAPLHFERRPDSRDWIEFGKLAGGELRDLILEANDRLADSSHHFGYRVANEIARFVLLAAEQAGGQNADRWAALDLAVLQKVLPKFHGTQQELEPAVRTMLGVALNGAGGKDAPEDAGSWRIEHGLLVGTEGTQAILPRTAAKLWRMRDQLRRQGFASFIQ
jgi:5-methylcytosine-specific restriction enzyme B